MSYKPNITDIMFIYKFSIKMHTLSPWMCVCVCELCTGTWFLAARQVPMFYSVVVQSVWLLGTDTWLLGSDSRSQMLIEGQIKTQRPLIGLCVCLCILCACLLACVYMCICVCVCTHAHTIVGVCLCVHIIC